MNTLQSESAPDVENLSDRALLAELVGKRDADALLTRCGGSVLKVFAMAEPSIPHMPVIAGEVDCELDWALKRLRVSHQLVRRMLYSQVQRREVFSDPRIVKDYLRTRVATLQHEVFIVLTLDAANNLIAATEVARGTLSQTSVYPREVVRLALCQSAGSVILVHNHPTGQLEPSRADEHLTQVMKAALSLVDVRVIDHFIVSAHGCMSFAERGLL